MPSATERSFTWIRLVTERTPRRRPLDIDIHKHSDINILKLRGIPRISYVCIIAAPYGLLKLSQTHPDIDIYVAALDESLNDRGYILPGLGDAGDRQFGTL